MDTLTVQHGRDKMKSVYDFILGRKVLKAISVPF